MKKFLSILLLSVFAQGIYSFNLCSPVDNEQNNTISFDKLSEDEILKIIIDKTYCKDDNVIDWVEKLFDVSKTENNKKVNDVIATLIPFDGYELDKTIDNMIIKLLEADYEMSFVELQEDSKKEKYEDTVEEQIVDMKTFLMISHPFVWAVLSNNLKLMEGFIKKGFDVNSFFIIPDVVGFSVLSSIHVASLFPSHLDILKLLVDSGAKVTSVTDIGETALHFAVETEDLDVVKFLVNSGADVNARDIDSLTPLDYAKDLGSLEIVKFLIDSGAVVDYKDSEVEIACDCLHESEYPKLWE